MKEKVAHSMKKKREQAGSDAWKEETDKGGNEEPNTCDADTTKEHAAESTGVL